MTRTGLTLIGALIVVVAAAILAVLVVPPLADASEDGRGSALARDLYMIREQIRLFRSQHKGIAPARDGRGFVDQFTRKTDDDGRVDPKGTNGPYVRVFPTNPFTGTNTVECGVGEPGGGDHGWYFDVGTGQFFPDDDDHKGW